MKKKFSLDFERPLAELTEQLGKLREMAADSKVDFSTEIAAIEKKIEDTQKKIYSDLTAWQKVQLSRHPMRPYSLDYIQLLFEGFQELHGDRCFRDDQAIIGGTAFFEGRPVMIVAQQKGRNTKENLRRNFGSPNPEGYRKALRLMRLAEKFQMPLICLIDTPGAYPGIGAEERHVAEAIAVNLREMSILRVPIVAAVIGEGGSGGALGIAVADRVLILENAYYSVISPEGCAAILWKDRVFAPEAAEALSLTADKLLKMGIVDEVVKEPIGGAHLNTEKAARNLQIALKKHLAAISKDSIDELLDKRYCKYRVMGPFEEKPRPA
ncbi:MAG: acetyl-CoA carboxylase carboxyltransferase subunit alpha [Verrucomicrobia bacterium GWF2_51_19]|nr:MAG: acetyl-CoA carboxylase carboxyltransferase subunit alpha [Verrucomicrobia bacterium GWF2_51_19]HCJ12077.1 acetyl-CoA carboxylase carboxyl transferase subunit alpha [Opitutae bacterium]